MPTGGYEAHYRARREMKFPVIKESAGEDLSVEVMVRFYSE